MPSIGGAEALRGAAALYGDMAPLERRYSRKKKRRRSTSARRSDEEDRYRLSHSSTITSKLPRLDELLRNWNISLSPHAPDLLQRLLTADPRSRLTLPQLKAHPWWQANARFVNVPV